MVGQEGMGVEVGSSMEDEGGMEMGQEGSMTVREVEVEAVGVEDTEAEVERGECQSFSRLENTFCQVL